MALHQVFLAFLAFGLVVFAQSQFQRVFEKPKLGTIFHHPIQRVAVVGAGPAGLQAAAKLIEHNFTVRLFERAPHPGGNWLYSEATPVRESYPDKPTGFTDEIPARLPTARYYSEGDDGLTLNHRWTEHWRPRPVWYNLFTNSPKVSTELPDVPYDPETPWVLSHHTIQRHVRSYATHHCLNSNDHCPATPSAPRVTSYSTLVEKVEKDEETHTWVLTLRRLERLRESNRIREEWWMETFDAVVLASGPYTSAHVPEIKGIVDWSKAKEGEQYSIYHSHAYRHPERYAGKTVLIVGASVSASEIARDVSPFVRRIIASVRPSKVPRPPRLRSLSRFPNITEFVPEIASFEPLTTHADGIRSGKIYLINGSILQGIDEIIFATGYRSHALYPANTTTRRPENISWTGHYIPDPTLAFTIGRPWTIGRYQSYGFAKVWEGSAPLPPPEQMPEEPNPSTGMWFPEALFRRYITWLNDASLEHGGRFVEPPPVENVELLKYYAVVHFLNNTMKLDGVGLDSVSMLSGKLEIEDPWDALVDEDSDW
ncbi:FAD/NAD-P-binding domain-containing protein [Mycena albidolilacea]|uniref:FAD/NAD-P-binding domain-containing protein n=1 Tax=Mycena albidolilacea TaxID=1033008 RepID=A0AAD6ZUB9_9AGAR|nr:FAD/NAD-P-binding domain-containing protein [Mycena albidolilacea]